MILLSVVSNTSYLSLFMQVTSIIILFFVVLALAYFATKTFAKNKLNSMKSNNMKIIETIPIGFNHLHILKINEAYYLINFLR